MRVAFAPDVLADESAWLQLVAILAKVDDGWHLWHCDDIAGTETSAFVTRGGRSVAELLRTAVVSETWNPTRRLHRRQLVVSLTEGVGTLTPTEARRFLETTSFAAWFAGANFSRVRDSIEEMRQLARDPSTGTLRRVKLDAPALPFPKTFDARSARARALVLVLLSLGPRDEAGDVVSEPWRSIVDDGPAAIGYIAATAKDAALRASPANRILRPKKDRSQAKAWLLGASREVLLSHGIPPDALPCLRHGDHDDFLRRRLEHLIALEQTFMREHGVTPPADAAPRPAPIDTDE